MNTQSFFKREGPGCNRCTMNSLIAKYFWCINEHSSMPIYRTEAEQKPTKKYIQVALGTTFRQRTVVRVFSLLRREVYYANLEI